MFVRSIGIFLVLIGFFLCQTSRIEDFRQRFEHSNVFKQIRQSINRNSSKAYCEFCDLIVPVIRLLIESNQSSHIENVAIGFCQEFRFLDVEVCIDAVHEYEDVVVEVLRDSTYSSKELCSLVFHCRKQTIYPVLTWNVTFPPDKPKPKPMPPQPPPPDAPVFRILHLSDIHIDFQYEVGAEAQCSQPLCCRNSSVAGRRTTRKSSAGFWGSLSNCDLPFWTAESILRYAAQFEEFDVIYYTGDLPPHNVWKQTREDQLDSLTKITKLLKEIFPGKIFYSAVGNHEAAPCNLFPMDDQRSGDISWLYKPLADSWIQLGLPEETRETIEFGAFYTSLVRPGFRIISLNMNYCSPENFWLFVNSTDPLGQLQWMIQWLQHAEDHQEKVHIIGHIPPKSCLPSFSWNFHKIVNRYENTISGQFYGHTHNDEFMIFYDEIDRQRPISMGYITPSLTTYSNMNPAYRIYKVDGFYRSSSFWVLDHRTVILNLTSSNVFNETIFVDEYAARDAFQMDFLFADDWNLLVERLNNSIDGSLMDSVYRFYTKSAIDPRNCKLKCRQSLLCSFITDRSEDRHRC